MSLSVDQNKSTEEPTKASNNSILKPTVDYGCYQQEELYQDCGTYHQQLGAELDAGGAYPTSYYAQYVTFPASDTTATTDHLWPSSANAESSCSYYQTGYVCPAAAEFEYSAQQQQSSGTAVSGYGWLTNDYWTNWTAADSSAIYSPEQLGYYTVEMCMNDVDTGAGGDQQYVPIEHSLSTLSLSADTADRPKAWTVLTAGQILSTGCANGPVSAATGLYRNHHKLAGTVDYTHWPAPLRQVPQRANRLNGLATKQSDSTSTNCLVQQLQSQHDYNPKEFNNLKPMNARYFVIKSYSEDDIHRSIKYGIWCSTEYGNKRLDAAYHERQAADTSGPVYLLFSVNGSGHFCGVAEMTSPVDYESSAGVWVQSKWKGQFSVRWIYVKDVPNSQLRHIRLENNEGKPVTNSRDTQEVPADKGSLLLRIIHDYRHTTSIFDDFVHYEQRQEECCTYNQPLYTSSSSLTQQPAPTLLHHDPLTGRSIPTGLTDSDPSVQPSASNETNAV